MQINVNGDVNKYYVQTLCMIFYPGAKFSDAAEDDGTPILDVTVKDVEGGVEATATATLRDMVHSVTKTSESNEYRTHERTVKIAVGAAIVSVLGEMVSYKPSWGILTGVRPSKVATEYLQAGISKTKVKKLLTSDYLVIPKKASLATEVSIVERKIIGTPDQKDCSIYISIPFCPSRCSYCSFVSYSSKKLLSLIPEYLDRLQSDLVSTLELINRLGLNIKTIYIGGGTPTILNEDQIARLLSTITERVDVSALEEFTLEAGRPDTITAEKLAVAAAHGVNRVSVNPQTLCREVLEKIGRLHSTDDFYRAYDIAVKSGIKYINTDLIIGLPGDNFKTFSVTFDEILNLRPANITVHTFCVKKSADILKSESSVFSMRGGDAGKCVDYTQIKSAQAGYIPYYMYRQKKTVGNYENVGFALEGAEGVYNIHMMEETHSIFSVGAGAVTKLVKLAKDSGEKVKISRLFNQKYPYEYLSDNKSGEMLAEIERFYTEEVFGS